MSLLFLSSDTTFPFSSILWLLFLHKKWCANFSGWMSTSSSYRWEGRKGDSVTFSENLPKLQRWLFNFLLKYFVSNQHIKEFDSLVLLNVILWHCVKVILVSNWMHFQADLSLKYCFSIVYWHWLGKVIHRLLLHKELFDQGFLISSTIGMKDKRATLTLKDWHCFSKATWLLHNPS